MSRAMPWNRSRSNTYLTDDTYREQEQLGTARHIELLPVPPARHSVATAGRSLSVGPGIAGARWPRAMSPDETALFLTRPAQFQTGLLLGSQDTRGLSLIGSTTAGQETQASVRCL